MTESKYDLKKKSNGAEFDESEQKIQKQLEQIQKLFSQFVLNFKMDIEVFGVFVHNKENEEVLKIKYGNQEVVINIDLVFKERTLVKAFGLEVESNQGFNVFIKLAKNILNDLKKIKMILED